jgi:hypothetical protein
MLSQKEFKTTPLIKVSLTFTFVRVLPLIFGFFGVSTLAQAKYMMPSLVHSIFSTKHKSVALCMKMRLAELILFCKNPSIQPYFDEDGCFTTSYVIEVVSFKFSRRLPSRNLAIHTVSQNQTVSRTYQLTNAELTFRPKVFSCQSPEIQFEVHSLG